MKSRKSMLGLSTEADESMLSMLRKLTRTIVCVFAHFDPSAEYTYTKGFAYVLDFNVFSQTWFNS